jgi:hypothetical protein
LQVARDAGLSLQSRRQVLHASMDAAAASLFDTQPFAQMRGQMGFKS